eukprot:Gregarina_sp_Pseudo_9__4909@NODE_513_length_2665_cov_20_158035_g484_i0_p1_GENE_NODE_513_length_2665_cov_20_158035_g484_i0NODE_513_length_2665_cov_20_158035_g484_i0_p1_ORF_typecomplete_len755_score90_73Spermine_synth/PF01564_17/3_2e03Spermine_synth/PF01564_17/2e15PCMT/PF01135_19/2_1e03PCMT/PF01135_19/0_012Methyltransf_3/PF01596_17/0_017MTS/PF05175_14/0_016DUF3767/PF12597_8/0_11_NODE_513_length_2665_cov_20_158035_g484_i01522416
MELQAHRSLDYKNSSFWANTFRCSPAESSSWYGGYSDIRPCLQTELNDFEKLEADFGRAKENSPNKKQTRKDRKLLRLDPCLDNDLSEKLHDDLSLRNQWVLSCDNKGVESKTQSNSGKRSNIVWKQVLVNKAEITPLVPEGTKFEVIIDRGFFDRLVFAFDDTTQSGVKAAEYLNQLAAQAVDNGKIIIVSLCQDSVLRAIAKYLLECKYQFKLYPMMLQESTSQDGFYRPMIMVITKLLRDEGAAVPPMDVDYKLFSAQMKPTTSNIYQIFKICKDLRRQAFFEANVTDYHPGNLKFFELVGTTTTSTSCQYYMSLYDRVLPKFNTAKQRHDFLKGLKSTIAVLVPLADQHCWLYKTEHGHQRLAERAGSRRILCVFLPDFGQLHPSSDPQAKVERIKEDIGRHLLELAVDKTQPVLLMTQQEHFTDDRIFVHNSSSDHAGKISIFDAIVDEEDEELRESYDDDAPQSSNPPKPSKYMRRTMIFECNPRMAQSEVWYVAKKNEQSVSDFEFHHVCHAYHLMMLSGLTALPNFANTECKLRGLLLGLGGGVLANLLKSLFGNRLNLSCVELDSVVANLAQEYFGFTNCEETSLVVGEGCNHVVAEAKASSDVYDFIIVDINKTTGDIGAEYEGVSCPPMVFLQDQFLKASAKLLKPQGLILFNVVIHKDTGRDRVAAQLKATFENVAMMKHEQDLNHVLICSDASSPHVLTSKDMKTILYKMSATCPNMSKVIAKTPMYLGKNASFSPFVRDF